MFVSLMRQLCIGIEFLVKLGGFASAGLMPLLAMTVSYEVFSRYFLNHPTIWAYDLSLFLFGYIASLGGAYAHQNKGHITVDIFYQKVSPKVRRIFDLLSFSLAIFFLCLVVYLCYENLQDALKYDIRRQSEWAPPMFHFWIMAIIASSLFILQLGKDMLTDVFYLVTGNHLCEAGEE